MFARICEECNIRIGVGSIGDLYNKDWTKWVCIKCYRKYFPNSSVVFIEEVKPYELIKNNDSECKLWI